MKCLKLAMAMACPPVAAVIVAKKMAQATCQSAAWVQDSCQTAKKPQVVCQPVCTDTSMTPWQQADIVDTAIAAGSFSTLVKGLQAAGLDATLRGEGPFTVLAPNDAAFVKLPSGQIDALLADPQQLQEVLSYHVLQGLILAADVVHLTSATTVGGQTLNINAENGDVRINDAKVINPDIRCGNGVIHVIDTVLIPPQII